MFDVNIHRIEGIRVRHWGHRATVSLIDDNSNEVTLYFSENPTAVAAAFETLSKAAGCSFGMTAHEDQYTETPALTLSMARAV